MRALCATLRSCSERSVEDDDAVDVGAKPIARPQPDTFDAHRHVTLTDINHAFGLAPEQIERLAPQRRVVVYKALSAGGGMLVGRLITRELVLETLKLVGVRLTTQQAAKFVPIAGQAVSALLTFGALRYVCEQHIRQCIAVRRQLLLPPPAAVAAAAA